MKEENSCDSQVKVIPSLDINTEYICMVVLPQYPDKVYITKQTADRYGDYVEKLKGYDYTDYLSYKEHFLCLENSGPKYTVKELQPMGILLGVIPGHSGNVLVRQIFEGHPQILEIEEYGYLNDSLYYICVRLSEKRASEILQCFWKMFERETEKKYIAKTQFPDREMFNLKMTEMLNLKERFTSQELFVMFHIAYETMHGRNMEKLGDKIIYWEPHGGRKEVTRDYAKWLGDSEVKGFSICLSRNRYANAGSQFRFKRRGWLAESKVMNKVNYRTKKHYDNWNEQAINFEDLKIKPKEVLTNICEWLGIRFDNALMDTTQHGKNYVWLGVTGFDVKPAYNIYEEYFSEFDRMRICMLASSHQRQNGYPYISSLEFTRREIQEMFLKDFRWELSGDTSEKNIITVYKRHCHYMKSLWRESFADVMDIELEEELM